LAVGIVLITACSERSEAQTHEDNTIAASQAVINELIAVPLKGIPRSLLSDAHAVAVIPGVIKGGFVIGARYGKGVILQRTPDGGWQAPMFMTLTGGNVGWQAGVQSTDVVLVFKTKKSVDRILTGKLTLGGDAAIAAGPVGREASAATDSRLGAEIYSYSRSRGLFVGVSIDGSVLKADAMANASYYRSPGPGLPAVVPEPAIALAQQVAAYCGAPTAVDPAASANQPSPAPPVRPPAGIASREDTLRTQLAHHAPDLYQLLDPQWQAYLALPSGVFVGNDHPPVDALRKSLANFDAVAGNPQYRTLAARPEFGTTHGLLRQYVGAREQDIPNLVLPPPPSGQLGLPPSRSGQLPR
jgi:lipid-binding SYLF domain-containing protein